MGRSPKRGDAAAAFVEESDVHERLIQSFERQSQGKSDARVGDQTAVVDGLDEADDDDSFTHEELLHSIGSFSAVIWPVAVTMVLAR